MKTAIHRWAGRLMWVPGLFWLYLVWLGTDPTVDGNGIVTAAHSLYSGLQVGAVILMLA